MPPSKIAILADVPLGTLAGLELYPRPTAHYATWLEALIPEFEHVEGLDLHWITFSKEANAPATHRVLGQTFHVLPRYKKLLSMVTAYRLETRRVRRLLRELKPELLHAWGSEDAYGLAGARSGVHRKLFTLQGCLKECVRQDPAPKALMKLQASFEVRTVCSYPVGTGESTVSTAHLARLHPGMQTQVIDYGVARDFFDAKWIPSESPNVLFAGSVCAPKGVLDLAEVFQRPEFKEITLNIAGDGASMAQLRALDLPNVRFLGRLSRPELIAAMESAWLLAIPTHADTGPSILKEARVVGLPVVTTTAAGAAHYITQSGAGEVVEPACVDALSSAIRNLTRSRDQCLETGQRSWNEHRTIFQPSTTAKSFAKLYREMLER